MYKDITKVWDEKRYSTFCEVMSNVPTSEDRHQRSSDMLKLLMIPEWKQENIVMDFVVRLPLSQHDNDAI